MRALARGLDPLGLGREQLGQRFAAIACLGFDLDEIQRLMRGFAGELKKLDEALQLLTAYLTRLRDKSLPTNRVLH